MAKGAAAALAFALLSYVALPVVGAVVSLVLAARAARRIAASGGTLGGDGLVLAARILSALALVVVPLMIWAGVAMARGGFFEEIVAGFEEGLGEDYVEAATLDVGDCFDDREGAHLTSYVWTYPCEDLHESEVIAIVPLDDERHPGLGALKARAVELCRAEFARYVGIPWERSPLEVIAFYPTAGEWTRKTNRRVVCATEDVSGEYSEGSIRAR